MKAMQKLVRRYPQKRVLIIGATGRGYSGWVTAL